ncbi:hypothetical protein SFUMM280S_08446 [Streptomyces fumanus]
MSNLPAPRPSPVDRHLHRAARALRHHGGYLGVLGVLEGTPPSVGELRDLVADTVPRVPAWHYRVCADNRRVWEHAGDQDPRAHVHELRVPEGPAALERIGRAVLDAPFPQGADNWGVARHRLGRRPLRHRLPGAPRPAGRRRGHGRAQRRDVPRDGTPAERPARIRTTAPPGLGGPLGGPDPAVPAAADRPLDPRPAGGGPHPYPAHRDLRHRPPRSALPRGRRDPQPDLPGRHRRRPARLDTPGLDRPPPPAAALRRPRREPSRGPRAGHAGQSSGGPAGRTALRATRSAAAAGPDAREHGHARRGDPAAAGGPARPAPGVRSRHPVAARPEPDRLADQQRPARGGVRGERTPRTPDRQPAAPAVRPPAERGPDHVRGTGHRLLHQ